MADLDDDSLSELEAPVKATFVLSAAELIQAVCEFVNIDAQGGGDDVHFQIQWAITPENRIGGCTLNAEWDMTSVELNQMEG